MKKTHCAKVLFTGTVLISSFVLQARSPKKPKGFPVNGTVSCLISYTEQIGDSFNSVEGTAAMEVLKGTSYGNFNLKDITKWYQKNDTKQIPNSIKDPHFVGFSTDSGENILLQAAIAKTDPDGEVRSYSKAHTESRSYSGNVNVDIFTPKENQLLTLAAKCIFIPVWDSNDQL